MNFINRNPKIIILSGKAQSGKSFIASLIVDYYNSLGKKSVSISYAKYLKDYAKDILGWDGSEDSKPRDFLQQVGVELIKDKINPNMLINRVCEDVMVYSYFYDVIVISDARFVDEINVIKSKFDNVVVIHIDGKDNSLTIDQKNHSTETSLDGFNDYDYVILNNGNVDDLKKKVFEVLR